MRPAPCTGCCTGRNADVPDDGRGAYRQAHAAEGKPGFRDDLSPERGHSARGLGGAEYDSTRLCGTALADVAGERHASDRRGDRTGELECGGAMTIDDETRDRLIGAARAAATRAHAPYSKFGVGAAILLNDGSLVTGANFENA